VVLSDETIHFVESTRWPYCQRAPPPGRGRAAALFYTTHWDYIHTQAMSTPHRPALTVPDAQAVAILRTCRWLIATIEASGEGLHYHPSAIELVVLQSFADVVHTAAARPDGADWLSTLRHRAGLAPQSIELLSGVLRTYDARHSSPATAREHLKRWRAEHGTDHIEA
jgi:hypothetical protein